MRTVGSGPQRSDLRDHRTDQRQTPSTKAVKVFLETLLTANHRKVLVVIGRSDEIGTKSVRNLPGVRVISPDQLNTYDVLDADDLVFSVEALNAYIQAHSDDNEADKEEVTA